MLDSGNENIIYVSMGKEVKSFDVQLVIIIPVVKESVFCFVLFLVFWVFDKERLK